MYTRMRIPQALAVVTLGASNAGGGSSQVFIGLFAGLDLFRQPACHATAARPSVAGFGVAVLYGRATLPADALARELATDLAPAAFEFRQLATQGVNLDALRTVVGLIEGAEKGALLIEIEFREPSRDLLFGKFTVGPCHRSYS